MASYAATLTLPYGSGAYGSATIATAFSTLCSAFTSCGLVQTADSGQVVVSTIVNTFDGGVHAYGYNLWKFTDTNSGSFPILFKIEFGMNNFTPTFYLTVGSSTDGAGNMTGTCSPRLLFWANGVGPDNSILQNLYISGNAATTTDNARLGFTLADGPTRSPGLVVSIERTVDKTGADTTVGIIFHATTGVNTYNTAVSMMIPYNGVLAGPQSVWISALNKTDSSLVVGTNVGVCLVVPFNFIPYPPGKNVVLYYGSDFPIYTPSSITVYGSGHTYMPLNQQPFCSPNGSPSLYGQAGFPSPNILLRYE
jgi:hypothetical protein